MKSPDDLKRETKALLESEREQRLDREARERRDGPILDAYDRLQSGQPLASELARASRHPPILVSVDDLDDQDQQPLSVPVTLVRCDGSHTAGVCHDPQCKFRNNRAPARRRRRGKR